MARRDEIMAQLRWVEDVLGRASRLRAQRSGEALRLAYSIWGRSQLAERWEQTRGIDAIAGDDPSQVRAIEAIRRAEERHGEISLFWCQGLNGRVLEDLFGPDHWEDVEWAAGRCCDHEVARMAPPTPQDGRASDRLLETIASTWRASNYVGDDLLSRVDDVRHRARKARRETGAVSYRIGPDDDLTLVAAVVGDPGVVQTLSEVEATWAACTPPPGMSLPGEFAANEGAYNWFIGQARAGLAAR